MDNRFLSAVAAVLLGAVVGYVLYIGRPVMVPIVFGVIVTYIIIGLTTLLQRIPGVGPRLPASLCYALSIVLIAVVIVTTVNLVVANKDVLIAVAPRYQDAALRAFKAVSILFHLESEPTWETVRRELLARINLQAAVGTAIASLSSFLVDIVVVLLYAAFLLLERRVLGQKLEAIFRGTGQAARARVMIAEISERIGTYLALKTLLGVLLAVLSYAVMRWMSLEFAELWALLIALLNFIPYLGSLLSVMLPVVMSVLQFGQPGDILLLLILLTVIQFVVGNIVDPYLMGNSLNLSPVAILASIAVWSSLWGIPGAFLAVPLTVSLVMVLAEFGTTRAVAILLSKDGNMRHGA